jgi:hypothetical protein
MKCLLPGLPCQADLKVRSYVGSALLQTFEARP